MKLKKIIYCLLFIVVSISFVGCDREKNGNNNQGGNEEVLNCQHKWNYDSTITDLTCEKNGEYLFKCEICEETKIQIEKATGHTNGEWTTILEPTCEEDGKEVICCTICQKQLLDRKIQATGHTNGEWTTILEPTCEEDGKEVIKCEKCKDTLQEKNILKKGHTFIENQCNECKKLKSSEGLYFSLSDNEYTVYIGNCSDKTVVIPSFYNDKPVTKIGEQAFYYNEVVETVKFFEDCNIEVIEYMAFQGCSNLKEIYYPKSLRIIEKQAFYNCEKLISGEFNEGIESIGITAFKNTGITTVVIPESLEIIGDGAFSKCENLETVRWNAISTGCSFSGTPTNNFFSSTVKYLYLGNTVTSLCSDLFRGTSIKTVVIPSSLISLGANVFSPIMSSIMFEDTTGKWMMKKQGSGTTFGASAEPEYIASIYNSHIDYSMQKVIE